MKLMPIVAVRAAWLMLPALAAAQTHTWTAGDYTAAALPNPLPAAATLLVLPGSTKTLDTTVTTWGQVQWAAPDLLRFMSQRAVWVNEGLFDAAADFRMAPVSTGLFDNHGTLRKSGGSGELLLDVFVTQRAGAVLDADSGSLRYRAGGTFEAGGRFTGRGQHVFQGPGALSNAFRFSGDLVSDTHNLRFVTGYFAAQGTVRIDTDLAWAGGTWFGSWSQAAGRTLRVLPGGAKVLEGDLANDGRIQVTGSERLSLGGTAALANRGEIVFEADGQLVASNVGTLANSGLISKAGGSGTARVAAGLTNTGVIEVASGTLQLPDNWANAGLLRGTAAFESSLVVNQGVIAPGLPTTGNTLATLAFAGALRNHDAGVLAIDLAAGGLSDEIVIGGAVQFDGWLQLSPTGGYQAALGDRFRVARYASFSGSFDGVQASGFAPGTVFTPIYDAQSLWLQVTTVPVPEPASGALLLAGALLIARQRSLRISPVGAVLPPSTNTV